MLGIGARLAIGVGGVVRRLYSLILGTDTPKFEGDTLIIRA